MKSPFLCKIRSDLLAKSERRVLYMHQLCPASFQHSAGVGRWSGILGWGFGNSILF